MLIKSLRKILKNAKMCLRDLIITSSWRKKLKNENPAITIFSSDCTGGMVYHDFHMRFNSPTINMFFEASDFLKFIVNTRYYIDENMIDVTSENDKWPVAQLGDIKLQLVHYRSVEEAQKSWNIRKKRINWDNIYYIFNDRNNCSESLLKEFDILPYEKKVVFTHKEYKEINSAFYIKGFENEDYVGTMTAFINPLSLSRRMDIYDWNSWFS